MEIVLANLIILGINVMLVGLNFKLYTEYFKDKSFHGKRVPQ